MAGARQSPLQRALRGDRTVTRANGRPLVVTRDVDLEEVSGVLEVRPRAKGGNGRIVDAYAAVFMRPAEILDPDGHYREQNRHTAFARSLNNPATMRSIFSVYNHGKTLHGTPSDLWSVPVGVPVPSRAGLPTPLADDYGLLTSTEYNSDDASQRILAAIKSGSLRGMSYTGVFVRSVPELPGPYEVWRPDRDGELTLVTREEIALIEYGATPIPAFDDAAVVAVRSGTSNGLEGAAVDDNEPVREQVTLTSAPGGDAPDGWTGDPADPEPARPERGAAPAEPRERDAPVVPVDGNMPAHIPGDSDSDGGGGPVDDGDGFGPAPAGEGVDPELVGERGAWPPARHSEAERASSAYDGSAWNAQRVWTAGLASSSPSSFFSATCAGRRSGDPKLAATWALPHHYRPGSPPNAAGVSAALQRLGQTEGLTNASAARAHLEAHAASIRRAKGTSDSGSGAKAASSSADRHPPAPEAEGTGQPAERAAPDVPAAPELVPAAAGPGAPPADPPPVHSAQHPHTEGTMHDRMTVDERLFRQGQIRTRLQEIDSEYMGSELPGEVRNEWDSLREELVVHERAISDAQARSDYLQTIMQQRPDGFSEGIDRTVAGYDDTPPGGVGRATTDTPGTTYRDRNGSRAPAFAIPHGDLFDLAAIRHRARSWDEVPVLYREYAHRALDQARFPGAYPMKTREECQETVARLIDSVDDDKGSLAHRILVTGSPLYERAFGKMIGSLSTAGLTAEESRAMQLGVDATGGYAVPFQLDPTVILTSNGSINPLRQIARKEQIVGKEWDGVTSAGVTVTRVPESTEAGTGDPALAQPTVRTTRVQGFVPFSVELDVTWGALRSTLTGLLMDAKDIEENTSFTLGNGTAPQCAGVIQTMPAPSIVNTAGTATLAIADLYTLENQMPPRFRAQSSYMASKATFNRFRQLFQALASAAFDSWVRPSAGTPATFNGYPAYEASDMTTSIASGSRVLLQGDFSKYLIVDRVGMGIELIPHLFGSTNRFPTGQRGILAIWFNNGVNLVPNAFRLLTTT